MERFLLLLTLICVCALSVCAQTISAPNPILDADEHAVYYEVAEGDASSETLPAIERKTISGIVLYPQGTKNYQVYVRKDNPTAEETSKGEYLLNL